MRNNSKIRNFILAQLGFSRRLFAFFAIRAHSLIMAGAIFCTLAVKLYFAFKVDRVNEYVNWILADIAVLFSIELLLSAVCFRWPGKWMVRASLLIATLVCTWSVINAGWIIATGTQILPYVLLPLIRDPLNALSIVGHHLWRRPLVAVVLLAPSVVALSFIVVVLTRTQLPQRNRNKFSAGALASSILILTTVLAHHTRITNTSAEMTSRQLRYNCHLKAFTSFLGSKPARAAKVNIANKRKIPAFDELIIPILPDGPQKYNVVVIFLEGIQYKLTSLNDDQEDLTPNLAAMAKQGVTFSSYRPSVTHTTKSMFSALTSRFPCVSQDITEAVPAQKPYASLATILKRQLGYRTAFFQSAKGDFECRPGLVHNLGFEKFWARENLNDPNTHLGYLASDEFEMLKPISQWLAQSNEPFLLTVLCSASHDPYEVPEWFAPIETEPIDRYKQTIFYTDAFLAKLDAALAKLNLSDNTIFCVIGDHGEAFGEHGQFGHDRILFEEALLIPWVMRAPGLIEQGTEVTQPVSNIDMTSTILSLLGMDVSKANFDGIDVLAGVEDNRKVYFAGWLQRGPAGFLAGNTKVIFQPSIQMALSCDLALDPNESALQELQLPQAEALIQDILSWRESTIFEPRQRKMGSKLLFDSWVCTWNNRRAWSKYDPDWPSKTKRKKTPR